MVAWYWKYNTQPFHNSEKTFQVFIFQYTAILNRIKSPKEYPAHHILTMMERRMKELRLFRPRHTGQWLKTHITTPINQLHWKPRDDKTCRWPETSCDPISHQMLHDSRQIITVCRPIYHTTTEKPFPSNWISIRWWISDSKCLLPVVLCSIHSTLNKIDSKLN